MYAFHERRRLSPALETAQVRLTGPHCRRAGCVSIALLAMASLPSRAFWDDRWTTKLAQCAATILQHNHFEARNLQWDRMGERARLALTREWFIWTAIHGFCNRESPRHLRGVWQGPRRSRRPDACEVRCRNDGVELVLRTDSKETASEKLLRWSYRIWRRPHE